MAASNTYQLQAPPVFVCGVQRSGTTLLVKMLSKHPDFKFLPQETHFFPLFWNVKDDLSRFGSQEDFSKILFERLPAVNYGWTRAPEFLDELCEAVSGLNKPPKDTSSLLRFTMHLWQEKNGQNIRTGEKTPAHIYYALKILKEFPQCKFVLMCRDPRAAALSELVKLRGNQRTTRTFGAFNFIVRWSTATGMAARLSEGKNAILLRYEDLISDPATSLKKVTEFLNIEMNDDMLDVGVTNSSFSDKKQAGIGFNTENLDRWKEELDPAIISLIDHHLGKEMTAFGYAPSEISTDLSNYPLLKQKAKLIAAKKVCALTPARFHHYNRNKKYRF